MSTLKTLKDYLVGENGYLIDDNNNGKTVMLSGAWGSGKTHFWLEDIKPQLMDKKQKNIYISLYGRESINELKFEVLKEAYNLEVKEDFISKSASMLSTIAPSFGEKSLVDVFNKLNKKAKDKKAKEILQSGSIICLDDFERKSKNLDLNDLFGYISQLALEFECKVVIILNSDVFEGEETKVFKTVKEKTVNKFFHFEPTIEELFESIQSNKKYRELNEYKTEILKAIKETKELNARIYIQVLGNCLEWLKQNHYNQYELRALALITVNFTKNHFVFDYRILKQKNNAKAYNVLNKYYQEEGLLKIVDYFTEIESPKIKDKDFEEYLKSSRDILSVCSCDDPLEFLQLMYSSISNKEVETKTDKKTDKETAKENTKTDSYFEKIDKVFHENKNIFKSLYLYAYVLDVEYGVEKSKFDEINNFVKTGILPPKGQ